MHILHLHDRLSERGGAEVHLRTLIMALSSEHSQTLAVESVDPGVESPCALEIVEGLGASFHAPVDVEGLLARVKPDVVHVHNVANPVALKAASQGAAVMTVHDHRAFCPGRGKWTLEDAVCTEPMGMGTCAPCFEQADRLEQMLGITQARLAGMAGFHLHVVSEYMARQLREVGVQDDRLTCIPPAVRQTGLMPPSNEKDCVLFVGRLSVAKGVDAAMEAWQRSGITLPLVFAGTGRERQRLEVAGFEVTGWLSSDALEAWYHRAAAVILPSRWQEPFGLVGIEALARGIPVVAWESGGVCEWHPGGDLLVRWGDVDGLGSALARALGRSVPPVPERSAEILARRTTSLYRIVTQRRIP
jgi:glycosyltransferase involved in cell wall biosynthesis